MRKPALVFHDALENFPLTATTVPKYIAMQFQQRPTAGAFVESVYILGQQMKVGTLRFPSSECLVGRVGHGISRELTAPAIPTPYQLRVA
jgi:hypothetical protein